MASKKGAVEGLKGLMATVKENPYGATLIGGALLAFVGGAGYYMDLRKQLALVRLKSRHALRMKLEAAQREADEKVEAAQREADEKVEAARREADEKVEAAQREADEKVEAARRETAEMFLAYGYAEEYANFQRILELQQAEKRQGKK